MKINELFETELNFEITGIVDDSRDVKDGYLFVATKGFNVDHYDYINDAIEKATEDIKREIVEVSGALAEKMLEREINTKDHQSLIDSFIEKIGDDDDRPE